MYAIFTRFTSEGNITFFSPFLQTFSFVNTATLSSIFTTLSIFPYPPLLCSLPLSPLTYFIPAFLFCLSLPSASSSACLLSCLSLCFPAHRFALPVTVQALNHTVWEGRGSTANLPFPLWVRGQYSRGEQVREREDEEQQRGRNYRRKGEGIYNLVKLEKTQLLSIHSLTRIRRHKKLMNKKRSKE